MGIASSGKRHFILGWLAAILLFALASICLGAGDVQAATPHFKTVKGKTYYIDANGKRHKGWLKLNGKKYYFNKKTGVQHKGWQYNSKGEKVRYFTTGKGVMATGFYKNKSGNTYYFNPSTGKMVTGWFKDSAGYRYYFKKDTGVMLTGWAKVSGKKRYFAKSTGRMFTGWWKDSKGRSRYFDPKTGFMYANTTATIDGVIYTFSASGYAKQKYEVSANALTIKVYDEKNARYYTVMKEYLTHPGIANGEKTDLDILAAFCESEAGDQGEVGMEAVVLCLLNRTIDANKEFPSSVRYVLYHGTTFPQYSVVTNGVLEKRLNGQFDDRSAAYSAARKAMKIFDNYVKKGTKRKLKGVDTADFNYKYFMMKSYFWNQPLNFDKVEYITYKDHVFFVDWVS